MSRNEALQMFQENKFKVEIISGLPEEATISLYRCGPMVDLCHGPHLPNTGYVKAAAVTNTSRAFWRADVTKEPLQARLACSSPFSVFIFASCLPYLCSPYLYLYLHFLCMLSLCSSYFLFFLGGVPYFCAGFLVS